MNFDALTVAAVVLTACATVGVVWIALERWADRRLDRYFRDADVPRARPYDWADEDSLPHVTPRPRARCRR